MKQLFAGCDVGEYVSRFKQAKGVTVYHGSKKSDILFKIYDMTG